MAVLTALGFAAIAGVVSVLSAGLIELARAFANHRRRAAILQRSARENLHALLARKQSPAAAHSDERELTAVH